MEKVYDLLSKTKSKEVAICEDVAAGVFNAKGLTVVPVKSCEDTLRCLEKGSANRHTGATAMHFYSSRSHAVFIITIRQVRLNLYISYNIVY